MRCHYRFVTEFFQIVESMGLNVHLGNALFTDLLRFHGPRPEYAFVLMRYGLALYPPIRDHDTSYVINQRHDDFIGSYENLYKDVLVVQHLMVLVSVRMVPRLGLTSPIRVLPIETFRSLKLMMLHHAPYLPVSQEGE